MTEEKKHDMVSGELNRQMVEYDLRYAREGSPDDAKKAEKTTGDGCSVPEPKDDVATVGGVMAEAQKNAFGKKFDGTGVESVKDIMPREEWAFRYFVFDILKKRRGVQEHDSSSKIKSFRVLDFGCGDGRYLMCYLRLLTDPTFYGHYRSLKVCALDVSHEGLRIFKQNIRSIMAIDANGKKDGSSYGKYFMRPEWSTSEMGNPEGAVVVKVWNEDEDCYSSTNELCRCVFEFVKTEAEDSPEDVEKMLRSQDKIPFHTEGRKDNPPSRLFDLVIVGWGTLSCIPDTTELDRRLGKMKKSVTASSSSSKIADMSLHCPSSTSSSLHQKSEESVKDHISAKGYNGATEGVLGKWRQFEFLQMFARVSAGLLNIVSTKNNHIPVQKKYDAYRRAYDEVQQWDEMDINKAEYDAKESAHSSKRAHYSKEQKTRILLYLRQKLKLAANTSNSFYYTVRNGKYEMFYSCVDYEEERERMRLAGYRHMCISTCNVMNFFEILSVNRKRRLDNALVTLLHAGRYDDAIRFLQRCISLVKQKKEDGIVACKTPHTASTEEPVDAPRSSPSRTVEDAPRSSHRSPPGYNLEESEGENMTGKRSCYELGKHAVEAGQKRVKMDSILEEDGGPSYSRKDKSMKEHLFKEEEEEEALYHHHHPRLAKKDIFVRSTEGVINQIARYFIVMGYSPEPSG